MASKKGRSRKTRLVARRLAQPDGWFLTPGRFHNIQALFNDVNQESFEGRSKATIRWGKSLPKRKKDRRMHTDTTLGGYYEGRIIRIHPVLDQKGVPRWFVKWVIRHEILHEFYPPKKSKDGRRILHHAAFNQAEQSFPDYERGRRWDAEHYRLLHFY